MRWGAAAAIAGVPLLGACAAPEFNYVKNSGQMTYFKVPHDSSASPAHRVPGVRVTAPAVPASSYVQKHAASWIFANLDDLGLLLGPQIIKIRFWHGDVCGQKPL